LTKYFSNIRQIALNLAIIEGKWQCKAPTIFWTEEF